MPSTPLEIVVATPYSVYVAPVGESFPDVDDTPAGNWVLLGTSGTKNMGAEGVTMQHQQTINKHRVYGTTAPVKSTRSEEDWMISFTLLDLLAAEYARVLNHNTVTATAAGSGTPGYDTLPLLQGFDVTEKAWLFRGTNASPEGASWNAQYELPTGYISSSPSVVFNKTDPAGLSFEITALFDSDESSGEELGRLIIQTATALA